MNRIDFRIPAAPGTELRVAVLRFGTRGARPKAYLQAALHGEELNGSLVIERLAAHLAREEAAARLVGEVILVPHANPIGLAQWQGGRHLGRFRLSDHQNFNRAFPNLADVVDHAAAERPTIEDLRQRLAAALDVRQPSDELALLRTRLLRHSIDADVILDLHQEECGILHLYQSSPVWPRGSDLAATLGAEAVILNVVDPLNLSFSEANAHPFLIAHARGLVGADALPLVATVELRGRNDATPAVVDTDAAALLRLLAGRGFLPPSGAVPGVPVAGSHLDAVDVGYAPFGGVVSFFVAAGDRITPGQTVARVVDLHDDRAAEVMAAGGGVVFARRSQAALVKAGDALYRVAGVEPLDHRRNRPSVDD